MTKIQMPIDAGVLFGMYQYAGYAKHFHKSEIAGWAHYSQNRGIYKLAPLVEQEITAATADTSSASIINDVEYDISDMIVHWHSHVDMMPSPSSTDLEQIKDTLGLFPMLISIIVNCKNQYSARLDVNSIGNKKCFYKLPIAETYEVELVPYYNDKVVAKEIQKKLKKPKQPLVPVAYKYTGAYYYNGRSEDFVGELFDIVDYIPPTDKKETISSTVSEIEKELKLQDQFDALAALDELAKLNGVMKTYFPSGNEKSIKGFLVTGKTAPYTLAVRFLNEVKGDKAIIFRFNGEEISPLEGVGKVALMLKQYRDITENEYDRIVTLLG